MDLCQKAQYLHGLIKAESEYVQNTAILAAGNDYATMEDNIISSGFSLARTKAKLGVLEMVKNFRVYVPLWLNKIR